MKQYLLSVFLLLMASVASAKDEDFDLVGQLRLSPNAEDKDRASVANRFHEGLSGFRPSIPLSIGTLDKELLKLLTEANGKWVGLCGVWEQNPDTNGPGMAFRPSSVAVLGDGFRIIGQIVKLTGPVAGIGGTPRAIIDCCGVSIPLRFEKSISIEDVPLGRRCKVYGSFRPGGHKGLIMAFEVTKIEVVPSKPDAGDGK